MRCFLLLLALWCGANVAYAQSATPVATIEPFRAAAPTPDTAAAIHRLFETKRRGQTKGLLLTAGAGALASGVLLGSAPKNDITGQSLAGFAVIPITLTTLLVELVSSYHYTEKAEARALQAWQQQRLPARLKRKLKAQYFLPAPPLAATHH